MASTTEVADDANSSPVIDFYVGLGLAISSSGFIGASFIIKKRALIRLQRYGGLRASAGGFGYIKEWIWWAGLLSMGIGEAANFAAYAFAPASLVTPLGALSVLVSALLAAKYLNEKVNLLGKIGCLLCVMGSTIIVLHAPKEEEVDNLQELIVKVKQPVFLSYILIVIACSLLIIFHLGPKYGKQNILIYITLCSAIGSLNVMSCKAMAVALKESISGVHDAFRSSIVWVFILSAALCIPLQMDYLNKALDLFETTVVTPIYYVLFTTLVIVASAILCKEWHNMSTEDVLGSICGFITVVIGIFLLNAFKDVNVQFGSITQMLRPKRDTFINHNIRWDIRGEERLISRSESVHDYTYGASEVTRTI